MEDKMYKNKIQRPEITKPCVDKASTETLISLAMQMIGELVMIDDELKNRGWKLQYDCTNDNFYMVAF
jgi:hypothetical protein